MSEEEMSWFHCGKCGALFMSPMGMKENRVCTECGRSPIAVPARAGASEAVASGFSAPVRTSERRGKRAKGRSKKALIFKILCGWLLFLGVILLIGRLIWPPASQQVAASAPSDEKKEERDQLYVQTNSNEVAGAFQNFLTAMTPESRAQFVHDPIRMAGRMLRYYQYDSTSSVDLKNLTSIGSGVIHLPEGDVIEARWEHADGRIYQAFSRQEEGEWRLDWEDFVRYSDFPWASFLKENSDAGGEFRLLARERNSREQSDTAPMNIVLYSSRQGFPDELGTASPQFLVERDSKIGVALATAFDLRNKEKTLFGSKLPSLEPAGMIRVRVKLRRVAGSAEPTFVLEELLACHWLDTTASGMPEEAHSESTDRR